jgi:hypothetical protein
MFKPELSEINHIIKNGKIFEIMFLIRMFNLSNKAIQWVSFSRLKVLLQILKFQKTNMVTRFSSDEQCLSERCKFYENSKMAGWRKFPFFCDFPLLLYQTGRINGFQNIENRFSSSFLGKSF